MSVDMSTSRVLAGCSSTSVHEWRITVCVRDQLFQLFLSLSHTEREREREREKERVTERNSACRE